MNKKIKTRIIKSIYTASPYHNKNLGILPFVFIITLCFTLLPPALVFPQETVNYYRVDKVITIRGEITDVKNEACFANDEFIIIYLKEAKNKTIYRVEVSPRWFFTTEVKIGATIEITGSSYKTNETEVIMARSMSYQGQMHQFRDKYGFPLWRGKGERMGKGKHMNGGRRGNGAMKGRGHS